jgi:hypothetical protein
VATNAQVRVQHPALLIVILLVVKATVQLLAELTVRPLTALNHVLLHAQMIIVEKNAYLIACLSVQVVFPCANPVFVAILVILHVNLNALVIQNAALKLKHATQNVKKNVIAIAPSIHLYLIVKPFVMTKFRYVTPIARLFANSHKTDT